MDRWRYSRFAEATVLVMAALFLCWFWGFRYGVFGSKVDWISQHSVIPDYFRQQFYQTGALFPEFAANLGGGQNIYNFSYYGLYSPVILISYLLPFMKMGDYLMAASIVSLALSGILFYRWLIERGIRQGICLLTSLLFLMSGPMVFHSYNQVMFVNYMPFLCMAFREADRYLEGKSAGCMLAVSVFLMIMTSFYFSIGGMSALLIYGIHRYLQIREGRKKITAGRFLTDGLHFLIPILTAVLLSAVLLVPTAAALSGRSSTVGEKVALWELFAPQIEVLWLVYLPYGTGLTTMVITVLSTGVMYQKWYERILSLFCIAIFTIPVFAYLLNGGLYIRAKALIPFLPLLCYMIACYLEKQAKHEISLWEGMIPCILTFGIVCIGGRQISDSKYLFLLLVESAVMALCCLIFYKCCDRCKMGYFLLILPSLLFLFGFGTIYHSAAARAVDSKFYAKVTDEKIGRVIETVLDEKEGFYRMEQLGNEEEKAANLNRVWNMGQYVSSIYSSSCNPDYQSFRKDVFKIEEPFRNLLMQSVSENPVFRKFMGVRYLVSERDVPGYELYRTIDGVKVYRCQDVSPIAYATDCVLGEKEYKNLEFPYNQLALLSCAVSETERKTVEERKSAERLRERLTESIHQSRFEIPRIDNGENSIEKTGGGYHIHLTKSRKVKIGLTGSGDALFLQFRVKNNRPLDDIAIRLESEKNKLTSENHFYYNGNKVFTYAVALEEGQKEVELTFGKGDYEIEAPMCFIGDIGGIWDQSELYQAEFHVNQEKTGGNRIAGDIEVQKNGYFITTIPYDGGFEAFIDGEAVKCERVNTAFLGFQIEKGNHRVELVYHAPGLRMGKILSLFGLCLFLALYMKRICNIEKPTP